MEIAWQYVCAIYDEFRSKSGLPQAFFSDDVKFNDQIYLRLLYEANSDVVLCSFCQEMAYSAMTVDHIYTDIDHFLPKDRYPHLSIHPYNLIPVCHICNSGFKSDRDPLQSKAGARRALSDIWMPYRQPGLSELVALEIGIDIDNRPAFTQLTPRILGGNTVVSLEVMSEIYRVVERWQARTDVIGEKLFRRMKDFLRFYPVANLETLHIDAASYFDELLFAFVHDDMNREPYALPMLWWLAHLISEELSSDTSALAQELQRWQETTASAAQERRAFGTQLRGWRELLEVVAR